MSIHRLRKLAGLNESITDNEEVNVEIERRMQKVPQKFQKVWWDVLEFIYRAGRPVGAGDIVDYVKTIYNNDDDVMYNLFNDDRAVMEDILETAHRLFDNVVGMDKEGHYYWKFTDGLKPEVGQEPEDDETDVNPAVKAQINIVAAAVEFMNRMTNERGGFSTNDLMHELVREFQIPANVAPELAQHIIGQYQSMLVRDGARYSVKKETPWTNDKSMSLLKQLAAVNNKPPTS